MTISINNQEKIALFFRSLTGHALEGGNPPSTSHPAQYRKASPLARRSRNRCLPPTSSAPRFRLPPSAGNAPQLAIAPTLAPQRPPGRASLARPAPRAAPSIGRPLRPRPQFCRADNPPLSLDAPTDRPAGDAPQAIVRRRGDNRGGLGAASALAGKLGVAGNLRGDLRWRGAPAEGGKRKPLATRRAERERSPQPPFAEASVCGADRRMAGARGETSPLHSFMA